MADPRDYVDPTVVGTPLRDGAVDPREGDFLGPINAGLVGEDGNPHGTNVVSPQIHASDGIRPVRPGAVSSDPVEQDTAETQHLIDHLAGTGLAGDAVITADAASITATVDAQGDQYALSTDDGDTWSARQDSNVLTASDLTAGTEYTVRWLVEVGGNDYVSNPRTVTTAAA